MSFDAIPVVDLAGEHLGERLLDVYGTVGFGYVVGHGIEPGVVDEVFEASRRFHALPHEAKMAIELNRSHRGFIPLAAATDVTSELEAAKAPNQSESFMMMREAGPDDPDVLAGRYLAGPNQWPAGVPGFRETLLAYHDAMCALAGRLVGELATALGDTGGVLAGAFDPPTTWLRLLHYPARPPRDDVYGSAPHTDFGCLTVLAQDDVGGLQVRTPDGTWVDAPHLPGSFVVNVGQMLHQWSNGRLLATPHRVINPTGGERWSVPFFYDPNVAVTVEPLRCCVDDAHPSRFAPVVFGDYVRHQLEGSYLHHGAAGSGP